MPTSNQNVLPGEILQLANSVGRFIEYWGFKSIHGKIWTLLYLSDQPLSAVEVSRKLNVSKTLLSFSIGELLSYKVILEAGKGTKRTVYFRANPDITDVILNVLQTREKVLLDEISAVWELVRRHQKSSSSQPTFSGQCHFKIDPTHLEDMGGLIQSAVQVLDALLFVKNVSSVKVELIKRFQTISTALRSF